MPPEPSSPAVDTSLHSAYFFRQWFRVLERDWGEYLPPSCKAVVWMVFDRTLGWGKEYETITLRQFSSGVVSPSGVRLHPGTQLGRTAIWGAIRGLLNAGALLRKPVEGSEGEFAYGLNYSWNPSTIIPCKDATMLKAMYKSAGGSTLRVSAKGEAGEPTPPVRIPDYPRPHSGLPPVRNSDPKEKREEKERERGMPAPRLADWGPGGSAAQAIANIDAAFSHRAEVRGKKAKASPLIPKAEELGKLWEDAVRSAFPDATLPTVRKTDAAILRKYAFRFCGVSHAGGRQRTGFPAFLEYLEWCVSTWSFLRGNRFEWAKDSPPVPAVRFFVGLANNFEAAWEDRRRVEEARKLSPADAYAKRLLDSGRDPETVRRLVEEKSAASGELRRAQEELGKVQKARAALQNEQGQVEEAKVLRKREEDLRARKQSYRASAPSPSFTFREDS